MSRDTRPGFDFVASLPPVQKEANNEIRMTLVRSRRGFGVELRRWSRPSQGAEMVAGPPGIIVYESRYAEMMVAFHGAVHAAEAIRSAER